MAKMNEAIDLPPDGTKSTASTSYSALRDEEKRVEKEEVTEVPIPWRTSRRLQEATLKSFQERSGSNGVRASTMSVGKKEKETSSFIRSEGSRSVKRHHSPTEPVTEIDESEKEISENKPNSVTPLPPSCINSGRKWRKTVHFANPVSVNIEEQRQINTAVLVSNIRNPAASTNDVELGTKKQSTAATPSSNLGNIDSMHLQPQACSYKLPLSCFDLLCNHVGPKGWRCYRVRFVGESFCSLHRSPVTFTNSTCIKALLNLNKACASPCT
ncbi:hypothetical protein R1sor_006795 [Riccia sorocarpa]|uniref:Uncharacterized protein n=1 Tax=Riccia sorocarpa TaxID=122646 RepID=A0ABD3HRH9_9MARC